MSKHTDDENDDGHVDSNITIMMMVVVVMIVMMNLFRCICSCGKKESCGEDPALEI